MAQETLVATTPKSDQLQLAAERTFLANERTLMSCVGVSTSLITFGFTLYKFFVYLREQQPEKHTRQIFGPRTYGLIMMGIGVFYLGLATWQHRYQTNRLRAQYPDLPWSLAMLLAGLVACVGILGFIAALFRE
jgi:putative membrane protein